jgi:putative tricarboxylic transport membrane protein
MVASIGVALEVLRGRAGVPEGTEVDTPFQRADFRTMSIIVVAIGLHVFLLERTGYIISAAISFWGVAYAFGAKKIIRIGIISLIFSAVVYFSFTKLLDIQLPKWMLEEWISKVGA